MSIYKSNKDFYNRPIRLDKEDLKNPVHVMGNMFSMMSLHEIRELLDDLRSCAMTNELGYFQEPDERATLLWFIIQVEGLIEAAYLLSGERRPVE